MAQIRSASAELIAFFETGDIPTADNFTDFILSTAVYDGSLPIISASNSSTASFGTVRIKEISGSTANITLAGSLIPDSNHLRNVGSVSKKVKEFFTGTGSIDILSSSLIPRSDNTLDLGATGKEFKDLYIDGTAFIDTIDNSSAVAIVTASFTHGISSSILPDADNTYDLGSLTKEWKDLFVDGVAKIDALGSAAGDTDIAYIAKLSGSAALPNLTASINFVPGVDNVYNLGTAAHSWKDLHVQGTATIGTLSISALANNVLIPLVSKSMEISGSILPATNNTFDLGSSTFQFRNLFIDGTANIDILGTAADPVHTASFAFITSSLIPGVDNQVDLGSSTKEWKNLFVDGTANIDILGTIADPVHTASFAFITSSLIPSVDGQVNLGSSTKEWKDLFIDGVAKIDSLGSAVGDTNIAYIRELSGSAADPSITASVSIIPKEDDTYSLGATGKEFKDLFIDGTANIDNLSADNASIAQHTANFIPSTNGTLNLGSNAKFWKALHVTSITSSGTISSSIVNTHQLNIVKTTGASVDSATYTVNGRKVEVRTQLQAQLNDGTFAAFRLHNTSIATDSVVMGSFTGNTVGAITASFISANTIAASTASFRIHNETGGNIANDTGFTASFVVF